MIPGLRDLADFEGSLYHFEQGEACWIFGTQMLNENSSIRIALARILAQCELLLFHQAEGMDRIEGWFRFCK